MDGSSVDAAVNAGGLCSCAVLRCDAGQRARRPRYGAHFLITVSVLTKSFLLDFDSSAISSSPALSFCTHHTRSLCASSSTVIVPSVRYIQPQRAAGPTPSFLPIVSIVRPDLHPIHIPASSQRVQALTPHLIACTESPTTVPARSAYRNNTAHAQ